MMNVILLKIKTTRQFYDYILNKHRNISCIGFKKYLI